MDKDKIIQLNQGFNTAFIDYTASSIWPLGRSLFQ